ncbi:MAG: hypothetical protein P8N52_03615 [Crocinitomicaceae bacterium]|nr:hypothetical protein [Crocinitomicaceae bacterium]MDG1776063.1 hypothetical protein [Crocinitomicaceae bacterium]
MSELFNRIPAEQLIIKELAAIPSTIPAGSPTNSNSLVNGVLALAGLALLGYALFKLVEASDKDVIVK